MIDQSIERQIADRMIDAGLPLSSHTYIPNGWHISRYILTWSARKGHPLPYITRAWQSNVVIGTKALELGLFFSHNRVTNRVEQFTLALTKAVFQILKENPGRSLLVRISYQVWDNGLRIAVCHICPSDNSGLTEAWIAKRNAGRVIDHKE